MIVARIESAADPRLAPFLEVRDRDALGPDGRPGLFVGESPLVIEAMLRASVETLAILASERQEARARALVDAARPCRTGRPDPEILLAPDEVLDAAVGFNIHRGFLAIGRRPAPRSVRDVVPASGDCLLLVVEDVNNIDNIGQLFRNAAAFGCAAVVLSPACHDPLYRKSLRVSCGHALRVPFARSSSWAEDLAWLREGAGLALVGATGGGDRTLAATAHELARASPRRVAVLVGAEFDGLTPAALGACSHRARIPMAPGVDSLNVGVAAGVMLARLAEVWGDRPPARVQETG
ncbi:MAG: RNA methyltransferase [Phycisphaerales bacterium]|nr:RNA methyltransferase [Phycisphaerales bacterium]